MIAVDPRVLTLIGQLYVLLDEEKPTAPVEDLKTVCETVFDLSYAPWTPVHRMARLALPYVLSELLRQQGCAMAQR